jgi:hypothetical protein
MSAGRFHHPWRARAALTALALAAAAALVLPPVSALAGDPGSAGLLSLRLGMGARAGAMGDTGVAGATDATAAYWNPANLVNAKGTQVSLQHLEYFQDFRQESFAVSHNTPAGALGLSFSGFYSDFIPRYDEEPVGVQRGSFRPYDIAVGLGYAYDFKDVSVGIVGKFLYQRIDVYDGSGVAVDLGISHRSQIPGLTLAACLQNYGRKMKLNQEEFDLPVTLRLGASYAGQSSAPAFLRRLTLAGEVVVPNDGNARLHAGAELRLHEAFALRAGNRFAYDTLGATFGAGFHRGIFDVDYAYLVNKNDFQDTHRFSVRMAFLPQPAAAGAALR